MGSCNKNDGDEIKDNWVIDDNGRKKMGPRKEPWGTPHRLQFRSYVPYSHKKKKLKLSCLKWKLIIWHLSDQDNSFVTTWRREDPQYLGWHLHAVVLHDHDRLRDLDVDGFDHRFDVEGSLQPVCHQQHSVCQQRFTDSVNAPELAQGRAHLFTTYQRTSWELQRWSLLWRQLITNRTERKTCQNDP